MREPHGEGVATHSGPESCVTACEGSDEALTGERAGPVLSRAIDLCIGEPTRSKHGEGNIGRPVIARTCASPARSETWRMHGRSLRGSREIPGLVR